MVNKKEKEEFSQEVNKFEDKFEKIMKADGQFWNVESASWYATIRTYIETCNQNNFNI